jgi:vacuolar protein sorting-associated protein 8
MIKACSFIIHSFFQDYLSETSSLSGKDVDTSNPVKQRKCQSVCFMKHGAILRHVILKSLSAQLISAADRIDAGTPTCLTVSTLVAVGTAHGIVMVFDTQQTLVWCLGGAAGIGAEFGAVTALRLTRPIIIECCVLS